MRQSIGLVVGEVGTEVTGHAQEVVTSGCPKPLATRGGEDELDAAPVGRAGLAAQQAGTFQPVGDPRYTAGRDEQVTSQLAHSASAALGLADEHQDLVLREGQVMACAQLLLQSVEHPALRRQQSPPRLHAPSVQTISHPAMLSVDGKKIDLSTVLLCHDDENAPQETDMSTRRKVTGVFRGDGFHWVGDGFHVTNLFPSGNGLAGRLSPFLLMDYHAAYDYAPTDRPRGVGAHPHRGFETVTLAFDGALAHHDSTGGGGIIRPGDVQWMTAARAILHKEYHEAEWARTGGRMHMMQLWVNLPAADKLADPGYQPLVAAEMGRVELPYGAGEVKVIAGEYRGVRGPARTFTPINLWDVRLPADGRVDMDFPAQENTALFVLDGDVTANGTTAGAAELILFDNDGEDISVESRQGAHLLLLNGEPIDDPVVFYGPFVMNSRDEIIEALRDFEAGKFGQLV